MARHSLLFSTSLSEVLKYMAWFRKKRVSSLFYSIEENVGSVDDIEFPKKAAALNLIIFKQTVEA